MVKFINGIGVAAAFILIMAVPMQSAPPYKNGLPNDPNFFPVGVWLQNERNAPEFANLGVNLFVGLWKGPTEAQLAVLAKNKMFAIAAQNDVGLTSANSSVIRGWMQSDEPDNAQRNAIFGYDPCIQATDVAATTKKLKAHDPTRPVFINFGQGVADPTWIGRGACTGDMEYYSEAVKGADILSFDIYPVATARPNIQDKVEFVGRGVDQLMRRASNGQSVWAVIETTRINSSTMVSPAQLRAEVWIALVHGARGLVYFVHEWTGGFRSDGIFRHPEIVAAVAEINRTVTALAPVINSPNVTDKGSVVTAGISTMLKKQGDDLYLFAVSERAVKTKASFQFSGIEAGAKVVVLNENRSVDVKNGSFFDSFDSYGVHIYQISLGASHR